MKAEFLKLRSMPTPRWTAFAVLVFFVGGIIASFVWGVQEESGMLDIAIGLPTLIASLVIGSWLAGVEFGQNTLRRVLGADPRRLRLVISKLAVLLMVIVASTAVLILVGAVVYAVAGSGHEETIKSSEVMTILASTIVSNVTYAVTAFSLTLLTRSMAGGMTLSFVFFFVLDGLISLIPKVGEYTISLALSDVNLAIRGDSEDFFGQSATNDTLIAVVTLVAWLALFTVAGAFRTAKTEVK